jgi:hypothetical protein
MPLQQVVFAHRISQARKNRWTDATTVCVEVPSAPNTPLTSGPQDRRTAGVRVTNCMLHRLNTFPRQAHATADRVVFRIAIHYLSTGTMVIGAV